MTALRLHRKPSKGSLRDGLLALAWLAFANIAPLAALYVYIQARGV